jgi:hypothetical protein
MSLAEAAMANGQSLAGVDTADLENAADVALTAFCSWRAALPPDVCEAYWRDVHGIMFARVPGLRQYGQLRLGADRPDLWPAVPGIPGIALRRRPWRSRRTWGTPMSSLNRCAR